MEKVGIVVCNYNKEDKVVICIQSILESIYTDYHIYVVDNASTDRSVERIREKYGKEQRLTLLCNEENLGGSGGFNTGLRAALAGGHEYLMCVDNDAYLDEECVGQLLKFLERTTEAGIAAAKIYHAQNPDYIQQYGSFINWKDYCVNSTYYNYPEDGTLPEVVYSDAVPACALMIRRAVIDQIGTMPEENFLYWDDTEWCYLCTQAGYKIASVGAAKACHEMGAKKEESNTFPTYYAWRNWIWFFLKYLPEEQLDDMADMFLQSIFEVQYEGLYRGESNRASTIMAALDDALHGRLGKAGSDRIFELEHTYDPLTPLLVGKCTVCIYEEAYPVEAEALAEKLRSRYPHLVIYLVTQEGQGQKLGSQGVRTACDGREREECKQTVCDGREREECKQTVCDGREREECKRTVCDGREREECKRTVCDGREREECKQAACDGSGREECKRTACGGSKWKECTQTACDPSEWAKCEVTFTLCESIFQLEDLGLRTYYMDVDGNVLATEDDQLMIINYAYSKRMFLFAQKPLFLRLAKELRSSSLS